MIQFCQVVKSFRGKVILSPVNVVIPRGSIALLRGPSGSGKSTLLRIICGLETADSGRVEIPSAAKVGLVAQNFALFKHLSVRDNLLVVLRKIVGLAKPEAFLRAQELLQQFALSEHGNHAISQLSGGQKQRLAIARALAVKPDIICMDEPSSALDSQLTGELAQIILGLSADGITIVLTSHDFPFIDLLAKQAGGNLFEVSLSS